MDAKVKTKIKKDNRFLRLPAPLPRITPTERRQRNRKTIEMIIKRTGERAETNTQTGWDNEQKSILSETARPSVWKKVQSDQQNVFGKKEWNETKKNAKSEKR